MIKTLLTNQKDQPQWTRKTDDLSSAATNWHSIQNDFFNDQDERIYHILVKATIWSKQTGSFYNNTGTVEQEPCSLEDSNN